MHCRRSSHWLGWVLAAVCLVPCSSIGRTADICANAAEVAAKAADVPREWMHAIALAESGRHDDGRHTAWPWTVNDQGKGLWFDDKRQAVHHVQQRLSAGKTMVDVGCFQINWRWHGQAFRSVEAAFDPNVNAAYAARFLRSLFEETGSWPKAVGRYHSATPALARLYAERVARIRAGVPVSVESASQPRLVVSDGGILLSALAAARPLLRQARQALFDARDRPSIPMPPHLTRMR
jgi:hypothetical protein